MHGGEICFVINPLEQHNYTKYPGAQIIDDIYTPRHFKTINLQIWKFFGVFFDCIIPHAI